MNTVMCSPEPSVDFCRRVSGSWVRLFFSAVLFVRLALTIGTGAAVVLDRGITARRPLLVRATRYSHTTDWVQLFPSVASHILQ
ncbi:hypothetical protein K443DRAFT_617475 [Laccaria amethystina LaAM-08-1]|jgi:hypothetical protein|uniref:Uncharacterized protein n=1 Tax=Laccaria amethystina LaAM-08-1 TaxID=1095629 RepID=A0A0C9WPV9_9AGAR|nr:hypothetical protein K443DRAFT_617475 [Laccaria amethystina LaAM-08-1]